MSEQIKRSPLLAQFAMAITVAVTILAQLHWPCAALLRHNPASRTTSE